MAKTRAEEDLPYPTRIKKFFFTQKPPRWARQGILKGNRQWESTSGVQQTPRGHQNFQFYHGFPSSSTVRTSRFPNHYLALGTFHVNTQRGRMLIRSKLGSVCVFVCRNPALVSEQNVFTLQAVQALGEIKRLPPWVALATRQ